MLVPGGFGDDGIFGETVRYFRKRGYSDDELYSVRQPVNTGGPMMQYISRGRLLSVRKRIEEVHRYAGAAEVDVIAVSMGVVDAIAAIHGGVYEDGGTRLALADALGTTALYEMYRNFWGIGGPIAYDLGGPSFRLSL